MEGKNNKPSLIGKNKMEKCCYDEIPLKISSKFVGPKFSKKARFRNMT